MSFRTVVITRSSKISYKNRYLVVKKELDEKYIHLSEIDTILIDSLSVSISAYLLKELADSKINVLFCDEFHNPYAELKSFYSRHNSSKKIAHQMKWAKSKKNEIWTFIVKNKIMNQLVVLKKIRSDTYDLVFSYLEEVRFGDKTNREGHAAKVYFSSLFGKNFVRHNDDAINSALNYGYAILLSTINKEVLKNGYLTQIGIHHKNEFNEFNLSCDLMECFRPIIDLFVYYNQGRVFDSTYKLDLVNLFNHTYLYKNKMYTLKDILKMYVKNTLDFFEDGKAYEYFKYEG